MFKERQVTVREIIEACANDLTIIPTVVATLQYAYDNQKLIDEISTSDIERCMTIADRDDFDESDSLLMYVIDAVDAIYEEIGYGYEEAEAVCQDEDCECEVCEYCGECHDEEVEVIDVDDEEQEQQEITITNNETGETFTFQQLVNSMVEEMSNEFETVARPAQPQVNNEELERNRIRNLQAMITMGYDISGLDN